MIRGCCLDCLVCGVWIFLVCLCLIMIRLLCIGVFFVVGLRLNMVLFWWFLYFGLDCLFYFVYFRGDFDFIVLLALVGLRWFWVGYLLLF